MHTSKTITLRTDVWEAVLKQIDGRGEWLTELEKDQVRVAYEVIEKKIASHLTKI